MLSRPAAGPCSPKTENARGENSGARIPSEPVTLSTSSRSRSRSFSPCRSTSNARRDLVPRRAGRRVQRVEEAVRAGYAIRVKASVEREIAALPRILPGYRGSIRDARPLWRAQVTWGRAPLPDPRGRLPDRIRRGSRSAGGYNSLCPGRSAYRGL